MNLLDGGAQGWIHGARDTRVEAGAVCVRRQTDRQLAFFGRSEGRRIRSRCTAGSGHTVNLTDNFLGQLTNAAIAEVLALARGLGEGSDTGLVRLWEEISGVEVRRGAGKPAP